MKAIQRFMVVGSLLAALTIDLLLTPSQSYAAGIPAESTKISVMPEMPTLTDPVQIIVNGVWSDGCVPYYVTHEISATTILIRSAIPAPDTICGQAITPWSIIVDLPPLPMDHYQVEIDGAVSVSSTVSVAGNFIYLPAVRSE